MCAALTFRWLGVAGIELTAGSQVLAVDPFFTRPSFWRFWGGRVRPDAALALEKLPHSDHILVTHAHYDHLMDVPVLATQSKAQVYGSTNTCHVCLAAGLPQEQVHTVSVGDRLALGDFSVTVLPARHMSLSFVGWLASSASPCACKNTAWMPVFPS
jgi:L-ascorbate metabolism protein UlaG (beta-lactamase superfamily)